MDAELLWCRSAARAAVVVRLIAVWPQGASASTGGFRRAAFAAWDRSLALRSWGARAPRRASRPERAAAASRPRIVPSSCRTAVPAEYFQLAPLGCSGTYPAGKRPSSTPLAICCGGVSVSGRAVGPRQRCDGVRRTLDRSCRSSSPCSLTAHRCAGPVGSRQAGPIALRPCRHCSATVPSSARKCRSSERTPAFSVCCSLPGTLLQPVCSEACSVCLLCGEESHVKSIERTCVCV